MFAAVLEFLQPYVGNPVTFMWFLVGHGAGLLMIPALAWLGWSGWMNYIQEKWRRHHNYIVLRIEVPQLNEQSMKAVEQIFVQIYGSLDIPSREEKYWLGFVMEAFSFEIESNGGYITFYIHTPAHYKNMVEAAFYAQYPDALLTEVDDYAQKLTADMIMNDKVRVWGTELKLANDDVEPIKSWPNWEHQLAQRSVDPLASILEVMTRLQPGEHWWLQIMAQPVEQTDFKKRAQAAIDAIVDPDANEGTPGFGGTIISLLNETHNAVAPWTVDTGAEESRITLERRKRLSKPEMEYVEEVDRKMSRWPFNTKIRWMYWAPHEQYDEYKGRRAMYGALQQFRFINWFVEGPITRVHQGTLSMKHIFPKIRLKWRARRMMWAYKNRFMNRGEHTGFVLNTEELASVFHFPQLEVRAPFVSKAIARGVEPPTQLNFTDAFGSAGADDTSVSMAGGNSEPTSSIPNANMVPERDETRNPTAAADQVIGRATTVLGGTGYQAPSASVHTEASASVSVQQTSENSVVEHPSLEDIAQPESSSASPQTSNAQPSVTVEGPEPPSNLPFV